MTHVRKVLCSAALLGLIALAQGCAVDGSSCVSRASHCEGDTRVYCDESRGSLGTLTREGCEGACVQRGEVAACVASSAPCDPSTTAPRCETSRLGDRKVRRCVEVFDSAPRAYLVDEPADCNGGAITACAPDGTYAALPCSEGNRCWTQGVSQPVQYCAYGSEPCAPSSPVECVLGLAVACRDVTGRGTFARVALPPGAPEHAACQ
ncbi:MAG: hypothetical protein R3A52_30850 [Polyangiales bacterium]